MAPTAKNHSHLAADHLCFLLILSVAALSSAVSATDDDSLCTIPSPAPELVAAGKDTLPLIHSFRLSAGYFFGGEDIHFARDESGGGDSMFHITRSFTLLPLQVDNTTTPTVIHVSATLTLSGGRLAHAVAAHRRRNPFVGNGMRGHSVSFHLEGYYSSTSAELCMAGSGAYTEDDGLLQHLPGVVLRLRVPSPPSLSDPFVTGKLKGAGFDAITLVAYAEGDRYMYGQRASCPPSLLPPSAVRGALRALGANFSCAHLREQLVVSYKLQHGGGGGARSSNTSPARLRLQEPRMHVGQVQCTTDGAVRLYATFSDDTNMWGVRFQRPGFMVKETAVVAEGRWNSSRGMLCLRACRVVRSGMSMAVEECDIGMSFWFPGVWTIRDRTAVAGMLWNSSQAAAGTDGSGVISVSSTSLDIHRSNFSDVKYVYNDTMLEEARKHYLNSELSRPKKGSGSFMPPNYTYHDFEFRFYEIKDAGHGNAYPVTIGSTIVYGDRLVAEDSFSRHAVVDVNQHELLNVSYDIRQVVRPKKQRMRQNRSYNYPYYLEERRMTAEGVFDPKTGILCLIACQDRNGSTDCQILITVQFASLDATEQAMGHGKGAISSLRDRTKDHLFFEKMDIWLMGMYSRQVSESISRMDLESVMLLISTTLPCVFAVLQILHVRRRREAAAATSITMLVVLALGYVAPMVLSSEALFLSRRRHYNPFPFESYVPYELSQVMMKAPTLIALLLQLRLIQLAWSARKTKDDAHRSAAEASSAAERRALWLCVPLYLIGGALTIIVHAMNVRRAEDSLTVRIGPEPATLWEDLVSSAGLALDAFLLPQVIMNALSAGAMVQALSPWFYVGGTVVRAMPHVYDVFRAQGYAQSVSPSYVYASPRYDRFGVAWDVVVPCGAALLAVLLFLQQRVRLAPPLFPSWRRLGEYEMVSNL